MQELTGVNHNTGDQNKDMTDARQARDMKDTLTVLNYLQERHPFCSDPSLRSISTGVHAHPSVNVDKAKAVGNTILVSMDGQTTAEYTFKKRDQAITMSTKSSVKIDGEAVQMDPQLLFQRLTIAAKASQDLASVFKYELCSHPSALFDISLLLRQPQKPVLADAIGRSIHQAMFNLLILLIYHANLKSHNLFFTPEPKKSTKKPRVWNIKAVKQQLGPSMCTHILFIHAIAGCDTTSRLYGIGKGAPLKKFTTSSEFREQATVFDTQSASTAEVVSAGENALLCLYNGKPGEGLDSLRHKRFCEKVATSTSHVQPQSLPPTSAAAKYHSLRVYYQVQQWKGTVDELLPQEWGWKESDGGLVPVQTDLPPAPLELLRVIRCTCKTDCMQPEVHMQEA
ncbi:hypothetical protein AAFF_G00225470 [Aldrovandia affinis]|uniref:Uncharacterized protein n=1 Tax=Aldrovandia affinis TaxID=143900 RepID=A0AAD7X339_9TELE|nr:hypothetical protein AAFF_G00225470 [Aldrovandia affinis]